MLLYLIFKSSSVTIPAVFSVQLSLGLSLFKNITLGISGTNKQLTLSSTTTSCLRPIALMLYSPRVAELASIKSKK
jgi:hypothetical protein